jgi:hypothetical protein
MIHLKVYPDTPEIEVHNLFYDNELGLVYFIFWYGYCKLYVIKK